MSRVYVRAREESEEGVLQGEVVPAVGESSLLGGIPPGRLTLSSSVARATKHADEGSLGPEELLVRQAAASSARVRRVPPGARGDRARWPAATGDRRQIRSRAVRGSTGEDGTRGRRARRTGRSRDQEASGRGDENRLRSQEGQARDPLEGTTMLSRVRRPMPN